MFMLPVTLLSNVPLTVISADVPASTSSVKLSVSVRSTVSVCALTVTTAVSVFVTLSHVACTVTVAVPTPHAVKRPDEESIVPTAGLLHAHVSVQPDSVLLFVS